VIVLLGAANRDPDRFDQPGRLDLGRQDGQPVSFGFGAHHCIGAALARTEGRIAIRILHERLPKLWPTITEPRWRPSIVFRGVRELPARFT
jgi:cytochrome P450